MKEYILPPVWDAKKFATRYSLDSRHDFLVREGVLVLFVDIKDDPPIFDLPDPPGKTNTEKIDEATTLDELKLALKDILG